MRPTAICSRLTRGLVLVASLITACDTPTSAPDLGPPPSESPVIIAKDSVAIPQGQSFQLTPVSSAAVAGVWASLDPDVVTVTPAGVAHAERSGVGRVTYQSNETHDTTTIVVPDRDVHAATVTVTIGATTLAVGATSQAVATVKDEHGATLVGRTIAWRSSSETVAQVSATGLVTAVSPGTATIVARTNDDRSGSIVVTVAQAPAAALRLTIPAETLAVGRTMQASAVALDANGNELHGRRLTWSSANAAVARVSDGGLITALAAGTAIISASIDNITKADTLIVVSNDAPTVATVEVTRPAGDLQVGQSMQLVARAHTANAAAIDCHSFTWATSNEHIATISSTGLATGIAVGSVTITATCDGKTGSVSLGVVAAAARAAVVTVTLNSAVLAVSKTTEAHAVVRDAAGNAITPRVVWTSSDTMVARVTDGGVVTAKAPGSATVTASVDGVSGSATLTVSSGEAHAITVTLTSSTLTVGGTTRANATVFDELQQTVPDVRVTWHSSNPSVATVTDGGLVTALHAGSTVISASLGTIVGEATLVITAP